MILKVIACRSVRLPFCVLPDKLILVSWPDGRSATSCAEEGRGSYEQNADESQDGVIYR